MDTEEATVQVRVTLEGMDNRHGEITEGGTILFYQGAHLRECWSTTAFVGWESVDALRQGQKPLVSNISSIPGPRP